MKNVLFLCLILFLLKGLLLFAQNCLNPNSTIDAQYIRTQSFAPPDSWTSVSSSNSSQYVVAVATDYIYTSTDFGSTWVQSNAPTSEMWTTVASSSSGEYLVAAASSGSIYTSSNYGNTWTKTSSPSGEDWRCVASSSSGQYLVATDASYLYKPVSTESRHFADVGFLKARFF